MSVPISVGCVTGERTKDAVNNAASSLASTQVYAEVVGAISVCSVSICGTIAS